jgi:hypothetical protein
MRRIWVAKAAYVAGTSRSKQPIFDVLTDLSRDTEEGFVSTKLAWILFTKTLRILWKSHHFLFLPYRWCKLLVKKAE